MFITYKEEICNVLNVKYSTQPNTKAKHMKTIQQFMKLEQVGKGKGTKYLIVEIYDSVQEREDLRKNNGQNVNSRKALEENRYINPRTIPLDLLHDIDSFIHLTEYARQRHNMTLFDFIHSNCLNTSNIDDEIEIYLSNESLFRQVGLYNDYSQQLLFHKVDLTVEPKGLVFGYDTEVITVAMNNLYNSIRSKLLCDVAKKDKRIVCTDNFTHEVTKFNLEDIVEVEQRILDEYNDTHYIKLNKFGDIYNKLTIRERSRLQEQRRDLLKDEIRDYSYDTSGICIKLSIRADLDSLIAHLGDLSEISEKMLQDYYEQLKREVFQYFYNNEVKRINGHYDKQIADHEERHKRSFGRVYKVRINDKRRTTLKLLDLCLKQDLTSSEIQMILQMIE